MINYNKRKLWNSYTSYYIDAIKWNEIFGNMWRKFHDINIFFYDMQFYRNFTYIYNFQIEKVGLCVKNLR